MVFGLSLFHFGAPAVRGKTSVFLRLEWKVFMGKYYVSTKVTPVLKACVHKEVREGENFSGDFNDICEHSLIQY